MKIDDSQYDEQLKKISRYRFYYVIPFFLVFFIVAVVLGGTRPDVVIQIITPLFILVYFIDARHYIKTKCPRCNERFFSYWRLLGFGNIKKTKCHSCSLDSVRKKYRKPYKESSGREWME
jgi:hypothetical protein